MLWVGFRKLPVSQLPLRTFVLKKLLSSYAAKIAGVFNHRGSRRTLAEVDRELIHGLENFYY